MIDTSFFRHLKRLDLMLHKRVSSQYLGQRSSLYGGQGLLFKDHRSYSQGDDFRKIDWRVFARTDKLHTKRYEEERNLAVHILIDSSASMQFTSTKYTKFEYASMIGLGFAYMAFKNNEKFVVSTFADTLQVFKAHRGGRQLVAVLDYLNHKKPEGESKFVDALGRYTKLIKSRSLVIIISDFLYDPAEIKSVISRFKNCDVKLVQVFDPMEMKLNLKGEFKLKDLETKGLLRTFIGPFMKKQYFEKLEEHRARIQHLSTELGASFDSLTTDTDIYQAFFKILA